jgi:phosphate transport system substrate-binding protein
MVACTNAEAYKRLADGETDIVFGLAPTQEQRDYAAARGLNLTETPIGMEALVFYAHRDNPARSLTQAQIRAVYGGRVRNWKELGGSNEPILAFQRPKGSRSQTNMLRIMEGEAMISPPREEKGSAGDSRLVVAEYRNRINAIGYSFRWHAAVLDAKPEIRLLEVDGVAPTPENIQSGVYPLTVPILAVTARPLSPQSQSLLDWILGPEGRELLKRAGYVPLPIMMHLDIS